MEGERNLKENKTSKDNKNIKNNEKSESNNLSNDNKYKPILANSYDIPQINSIMAYFWGKRNIYSNEYYLRVLKDDLSYVYKIDKEIIAVCLVGKYGKEIGIDLLCVKEAYQRMGLGKSLLDFCLKNCEKKGYTDFFLHVATTNRPAINLYKKFGFYAEKLVRDYYYKDEYPNRDAYLLKLNIANKNNDDDKNKNKIKSLNDNNYEKYSNKNNINSLNDRNYDEHKHYHNYNNGHNRYFYNHYHYNNHYHNKYNNNEYDNNEYNNNEYNHYHNHYYNNDNNNYGNYNYNNYGYYNYSNYRDGYWARYNRWNQ